jgi:hypothetical protein
MARSIAGKIEDEILDRLDLIINLLAFQVASEKSITEGARILKMAGLDNRTIASVLNTTDATVRTLTAYLRSKAAKRR